MQVDKHEFHGLLHSANLIEAELRRQLAPFGIQPRQARVIEALDRMGTASQVDLASSFGVTSAGMSTMTDRLLAAGYITRVQDPESRRKNILALTAEGQALVSGIDHAWSALDDTIRTVMGDDAKVLFDLSRRLRDGLGGTVPGTGKSVLANVEE